MKLINKIEQGIINTPSYLKTNLNKIVIQCIIERRYILLFIFYINKKWQIQNDEEN